MQAAPDGTPVQAPTTSGTVQGAWHHGIARFAGIPYAAPADGTRRFRSPQPVEPWDDVRPVDEFAPISPQNPSLIDALFGGESERWSEDCLTLNVWTPDPTAEGLPVMVWIHGGGFEMGSGSSPLYHGESFARSGVVLVSINYRLGAFGFLELGSLDERYAGSGNVGLLDQVAALEWVRDNIASFGGDPRRVTIFGESAGAMSVSLLLSMPAASGLFHAAIAESGAASSARSVEAAAADTAEFLDAAGLRTIDEVLTAPVESLLAAHATMAARRMADPEAVIERTGNPMAFLAFRPVADGTIVPVDPLGAVTAGAAAGIPLLIGTNAEEWKLFALMSAGPQDESELARRVALVADDVEGALTAYRAELGDAAPAGIECAVLTDAVFRMPAVRLADAQTGHAPVWQYLFNWGSPAWGGQIGAAHAIEIPFVFDLVEDQRMHVFVGPDAPKLLSRAVHDAWVAFARDGAPTADDLPDWPSLGGDGRPVMVLDAESRVVDDPGAGVRRFWESAGSRF